MPEPLFIPQPHSIAERDGVFALDAATRILIPPGADARLAFAASDLRLAVEDSVGLRLPIEPSTETEPRNSVIFILTSPPPTPSPRAPGWRGADEARVVADSYALDITPAGVTVCASGEAGLFYGAQTLIQALRTAGRALPALSIQDRPALAERGVMLDVTRGRVPRLASLKRLATQLARLKINQLQLYTEHTFHFSRHAAFAESVGALTGEEMRALDAHCRLLHIELVPNLQSFGHHRTLLSLPEYGHLDEVGWRWTLTPARKETYDLLAEMYDEMLPNFTSPQLNVDCDETWDHGLGQSAALAQARGRGQLYLDHVLRLRGLAAQHEKRLQMWADILHEHPELIAAVPDDITLLDWRYEDDPAYPTVDAIAQQGRRFLVCPGTSAWNTVFPRLDNAISNIRGFTLAGARAGAVGQLNTDWGDYGHYQAPSNSVYLYAWGAETAWTGGATTIDDFDCKVGPLVLGDWSGAAVAAMRRMGRAVEQPGLHLVNRSATIRALFEDPLIGRTASGVDPAVVAELAQAASDGLAAFARLPDPQLRHELSFAAHQLAFVADKLALTHAIRAAVQAGQDLRGFLPRLTVHRERLAAMRVEFETLWLAQSKRSEILQNLDHYDHALARYDLAAVWLAAGRLTLDGYTTDRAPILWEEAAWQMRRFVELVGAENLPEAIRDWATVQPVS